MTMTIPYLYAQNDLLTELNALVRDGSNTRWTAVEKYYALNQVLMEWAEKVKLEHTYTISGGWVAGTYEYTLPIYVRAPIYPELYRSVPYDNYVTVTQTSNWQDVPGWELVNDGLGGQKLRLYAPPRNVNGQVVYYAPNSRVPTTVPTTSGSTSSTATTMTIGSAIDVDDVFYIKCEAEWMSGHVSARGASTTTLTLDERGLFGTTAATHAGGSSVYWGVALDDVRLRKLLFDMWKSALSEFFLQDGGTHERSPYQQNLGYYSQLAANFWATYTPHRRSLGLQPNQKLFAFR